MTVDDVAVLRLVQVLSYRCAVIRSGQHTNKYRKVRKMQIKKREGPTDPRYENMPDNEFFSLFKNEYSYSGIGLNMEKSLREKTPDEMKKEWTDYAKRIYQISDEKARRLEQYMINFVYGFHVLTKLIADEEITDIKVNASDNIWVKKKGKRFKADVQFESPQDFKTFVEMLAVRNGVNLGNTNAIRTFTDKSSCPDYILRLTTYTSLVNDSEEPSLHIRKASKKKPTLEELIQKKMLTHEIADYLQSRLNAGYLLISGRNASGKTTLANLLLERYSPEDAVLVVQENEELFCNKKDNKLFQHIEVRKGDQKINYGLKELVMHGQMIDIDHIVIGEIKGEEALYFITAALTGCKGMATIHSADANGALEKMADYCKWASDYSRDEIFKLLSCVKTIVHVNEFQVQEIVVNHGWDESTKGNHLEAVFDRVKGVNRI